MEPTGGAGLSRRQLSRVLRRHSNLSFQLDLKLLCSSLWLGLAAVAHACGSWIFRNMQRQLEPIRFTLTQPVELAAAGRIEGRGGEMPPLPWLISRARSAVCRRG
jgi:hypothetical protein